MYISQTDNRVFFRGREKTLTELLLTGAYLFKTLGVDIGTARMPLDWD